MEPKLPVIWKGEVVGMVENLQADNFDLYGKWIPSNIPATELFLTTIRVGEQVEVQIGAEIPQLFGTIELEPDKEIEIKRRTR